MVMNEIILCGGDNTYKLPHAGKDKIVRAIKCDIPLHLPCQAMITSGSLTGNAIMAYVKTLPPLNSSVVVSSVVVASNVAEELSPLLLLAGAASNSAIAMAEDEGIVGNPDDPDACKTPGDTEFWSDFESKIAWGGGEYENHEARGRFDPSCRPCRGVGGADCRGAG